MDSVFSRLIVSKLCFAFVVLLVKTVVALAMLVRRFNFQMAIGAPPVSLCYFVVIFSRFNKVDCLNFS